MNRVIEMLAVCSVALSVGCASIVSKSQYPVTINSSPSGAVVSVRNKQGAEMHRGTTPMTITLNSSDGFFSAARYTFQFEKEGCNPTTTTLSAGINGWYFGNLLFGGLIGFLIVDPATGAMWSLDEGVYANLSPIAEAPRPSPSPEATPHVVAPPAPAAQAVPQATTQEPKGDKDDVATQLKKLKELKDAGVLTDEEYEGKRKALVEKL